MSIPYEQLLPIFETTRSNIEAFNSILEPAISNADNDHERLYFHHIQEEEEEHLKRLDRIIQGIRSLSVRNETTQTLPVGTFQLVSDMITEEFGLHNFREHLDLAIYQFENDPGTVELFTNMREQVQNHRQHMRNYMENLEQHMNNMTSDFVMKKTTESVEDSSRPAAHRSLTIGSLKSSHSS